MWVKYIIDTWDILKPEAKVVMELFNYHNDASLVSMFYALAQNKVGKNVQAQLKSTLITRWISRKETYNEVFRLLTLDTTPRSIRLHKDARIELLKQYNGELMKTPS